jgi:UDP-N-acetylglucosamine acyltransferase
MANVHATAIVDPGAKLGKGVVVGPYCTVGPDVELAEGVEVRSHVVLDGRTRVGAGTVIYPFASIGVRPQDLKYKNEPSELIIGANCTIREHVTVNPGTEGGGMLTSIGDNVLLMIGAHVAHDCRIGNNCIIVNQVLLGGHVQVEDFAVIGGGSGVHQFVRIGKHAMIGGLSAVEGDVIPYGTVMGNRARLEGLNIIGLKRRGFSRDDIHALRAAYRTIFGADQGTVLAQRVDEVAATYKEHVPVQEVVDFLKAGSSRAICRPVDVNAVGSDAA